jgi:hypothetical protein
MAATTSSGSGTAGLLRNILMNANTPSSPSDSNNPNIPSKQELLRTFLTRIEQEMIRDSSLPWLNQQKLDYFKDFD